ncbi:MAG: histidine phosphatase family protein [Alphaproteobacteria bacterium]|nr:histidine phosphatase family protein [Alphaproteobacteria bacterium]
MKKEFYIFRHGQTDMNLAGRWQGQKVDMPLNAAGEQQARELAGELKQTGMDIVFSSPLKRAVQTAQIVAGALKIPVQIDNGLIEGCFGEAEGKTREEIHTFYPEIAERWRCLDENVMDVCFNGGETKRQIQQRMLETLKKIVRENDCGIIGISTHSATIRCFALLFGIKMYAVPNGKPFHVIFENGCFEWTG